MYRMDFLDNVQSTYSVAASSWHDLAHLRTWRMCNMGIKVKERFSDVSSLSSPPPLAVRQHPIDTWTPVLSGRQPNRTGTKATSNRNKVATRNVIKVQLQ